MVASTIAMLVSHDTTTKGGGLPWFTFFVPSPSRYGRKHEGHPYIEKGINMTVSTI